MTIYRIHRAVVITALMTLMALLLMSCGSAPETTMPGHGGPAVAAADVAAVTEYSVHDLEAEWQDQQGLTLTLADLAGRPRIVAMVYTSCAHACPRILADMKRIEGELRSAGIDAGYVLVTIDPERDTPQRLAEYAAATRLDPNDWTLLTGSEDAILELAVLLGVRYRRVSDTDFEHNNVITLLDADGRIVERQVGLGVAPDRIMEAATAL